MLGALGLSLLVVVVLARTSGFRDVRNTTWRDAAIDGVEIVAVGLACALAVLVCLREITPDTSLVESLGKVVFEAIPFAVGAALARQFLARQERGDDDGPAAEVPIDDPAIGRTLADAGAAAIGALVLSFSIAPTDEIPLIASALTPLWLLRTSPSLLISYAVVFEADFCRPGQAPPSRGLFQQPSRTVAAYVISLAVAPMLLFFQRIGPDQLGDLGRLDHRARAARVHGARPAGWPYDVLAPRRGAPPAHDARVVDLRHRRRDRRCGRRRDRRELGRRPVRAAGAAGGAVGTGRARRRGVSRPVRGPQRGRRGRLLGAGGRRADDRRPRGGRGGAEHRVPVGRRERERGFLFEGPAAGELTIAVATTQSVTADAPDVSPR
jgi:putative integral membrane protein (TIGR02587 family)